MNTLALINILAQDVAKKEGSPWNMLILVGLMFVVMWVVMIRPQQKRQKELQKKVEALKKGDKVVTIGGLHGMINHVGESTVSIKVGDAQFMTFDKKAVATIVNDKEKSKKDDDKK